MNKRIATVVWLALALVVVAGGALFSSHQADASPRAVIIDQLSLSFPNPAFSEEATATLENDGYTVDYVPGEGVTVDFYQALPMMGYDLVLVRAHAALYSRPVPGREAIPETALFSGETWSLGHEQERQSRTVVPAVAYTGGDSVFAITPPFIDSDMRGDFRGALVVLMGCQGLSARPTADAFVRRGASDVIAWSDLVSADHTDAATARFLEHLVTQDRSPQAALSATNDELGLDPAYHSYLVSYEATRLTVP